MSLRFNEDDFLALDDKRHLARTSFQQLGYDLFMRWLRSESGDPEQTPGTADSLAERNTPREMSIARAAISLLREGDPDKVALLNVLLGKYVESEGKGRDKGRKSA